MKAQVSSKLNLEKRALLQEVVPLATPYLLYIDPSSLCNLKCKFCPTGHAELKKTAGYSRGIMEFDLFKKIIDELHDFPDKIKSLRLNKVGEPLMNKRIADMVAYAKASHRVEYIDFATNFILFDQATFLQLIDSGLDRLNISLEGVNPSQYKKYCGVTVNFPKILENLEWLYSHKKACEIVVKIPGNYLSERDKRLFFDLFGNYCDKISIENLTSIWPGFDMQKMSGIHVGSEGQYREIPAVERNICSYIFYSMAVNADGTVSACCPDWQQKLLIGNARTEPIKKIWESKKLRFLQMQHLQGQRNKNNVCATCGHIRFCQVDNIDAYADLLLEKISCI